jgi:hypothetical protein
LSTILHLLGKDVSLIHLTINKADNNKVEGNILSNAILFHLDVMKTICGGTFGPLKSLNFIVNKTGARHEDFLYFLKFQNYCKFKQKFYTLYPWQKSQLLPNYLK